MYFIGLEPFFFARFFSSFLWLHSSGCLQAWDRAICSLKWNCPNAKCIVNVHIEPHKVGIVCMYLRSLHNQQELQCSSDCFCNQKRNHVEEMKQQRNVLVAAVRFSVFSLFRIFSLFNDQFFFVGFCCYSLAKKKIGIIGAKHRLCMYEVESLSLKRNTHFNLKAVSLYTSDSCFFFVDFHRWYTISSIIFSVFGVFALQLR